MPIRLLCLWTQGEFLKFETKLFFTFEVCFRYKEHFKIMGTKTVHFGAFDCASTIAATQYNKTATAKDDGCC